MRSIGAGLDGVTTPKEAYSLSRLPVDNQGGNKGGSPHPNLPPISPHEFPRFPLRFPRGVFGRNQTSFLSRPYFITTASMM